MPTSRSHTRQRIVLALALALRAAGQTAHGGALSAVAPAGAPPQGAVNITGTGFDATATNNQVTFFPGAGSAVTALATRVATLDAARGVGGLTVTVRELPAGA